MRVIRRATISAATVLISLALVAPVTARTSAPEELTADLDGVPIKLVDVGKWFCHDFDFPLIHCYSSAMALETSSSTVLAFGPTDYATIYEFGSYAGAYMHVSQNYTDLFGIGWNDRVSSLKARNSEDSHFHTDWFYNGTALYVCCNSQLSTLGSFDNTFSSFHRN